MASSTQSLPRSPRQASSHSLTTSLSQPVAWHRSLTLLSLLAYLRSVPEGPRGAHERAEGGRRKHTAWRWLGVAVALASLAFAFRPLGPLFRTGGTTSDPVLGRI